MSNIEIKHLFRNNRLPENDTSLLLFLCYLPLGLILFLLRCILLLLVFTMGNVLPESVMFHKFIKKTACLALGICVNVENVKAKEKVDVYVSNNVTRFDHLAVCTVTDSISPGIKTSFDSILSLSSPNLGSLDNLEDFKRSIINFIAKKKISVYFTPEGRPTNGKGLLKFKSYPFEMTTKVQPICLRVERPFLDIAMSTLGATFINDLFFFMFCPITIFKLKFLPPLEKKSLTDSEFADAIRDNIAADLKVESTNFTSSDLAEWQKKKMIEQQRSQGRSARTLSPDLQRMTLQVKQVLPHVPFNAIYNDLYVTRNVDSTITNILEGRVHFISEQINSSIQTPANPLATTSGTNASGSGVKIVKGFGNAFPKSASERNRSFQERKEQLIANARRRYIEKHNLNIPF